MKDRKKDGGFSGVQIALLYGTLAATMGVVLTDGEPFKSVVNPSKVEPTPTPTATATPIIGATRVLFSQEKPSGLAIEIVRVEVHDELRESIDRAAIWRITLCTASKQSAAPSCPNDFTFD